MAVISPETAERFAQAAAEGGDGVPPVVPGQTTITGEEVGHPYEPSDEPGTGAPPPIEELRVDGTTQLAIDAGGKAPTKVALTLKGAKVLVHGHFRKGDRITGTFEAVVDSYTSKDKTDRETGIVTECDATFGATVTDLELTQFVTAPRA
jgi:hypothetical protein